MPHLSEREKVIRNMLQERIQLIGNKERINVSLKISHAMIDLISKDLYKDISHSYFLVIARPNDDSIYSLSQVSSYMNKTGPLSTSICYIEFNRSQFRDINIDMICE